MGRQIIFYIEKELQDEFIQFAFGQGFVLIAQDHEIQQFVKCKQLSDIKPLYNGLYFYKEIYGPYYNTKWSNYHMNDVESPVIQFSRNAVNHEKKQVSQGRIWMQPKYYNVQGEIIEKDSQLTKDYNILVKYIKKCIPYRGIKLGNRIYKEYVSDYIMKLYEEGYHLM